MSRPALIRCLPCLCLFMLMVLGPAPVLADPLGCSTDSAPTLDPAFTTLADAIGPAVYGTPTACSAINPASGDLEQPTSTGLAMLPPDTDLPTFTDGWRHWALSPQGLLLFSAAPDQPLAPVAPPPLIQAVRCGVLYTHEVPGQASLLGLIVSLRAAGYTLSSLSQVEAAMQGLAPVPRSCVVLSFDDALLSQFQNAAPVLLQQAAPAVFFVLPDFADGVHSYMSEAQIRQLHDDGFEVMSHTCHHPDLTALARQNPGAAQAELTDCKHILENIIGAPVPYVAYPNGSYNPTVLSYAAQAGYRLAFGTWSGTLLTPGNALALPRIDYQLGESPARIIARLHAAGD